MDHIFEHYKKTGYLHHAHVIEGAHEEVAPLLVESFARHMGIETIGNPDLTVKNFASLGIDEARELKGAQTRASFGGTCKLFVIGADSFTHEAQNALLKTFEEPTSGTHFFIILPRAEMLLPTLLSRVLVVSGGVLLSSRPRRESADSETGALAEKFVDGNLEGRFAIAKKMVEKKAGETVDRELFRRILDHIERILYTRTAGKRDDASANIFRGIFQAKTYLANRGASPKMLLEHIAIIIP
ncbi:MAG: hypothetical protein A2747_03725 [Candidatus Yonathbacteria bacterium RIFCSPHIGHO2_01_FULL_44_41]|uniref:DNA polymerase III subunit delta n=1 Tax=Candidatus Yonathbacteria bacterium RIFCSPHIGHO2_02_FULL_44_14 TaxID=1802724 RepID=A0A1G2S7F3_9BACT|nr:MAG: hypothetical protein A2747_03725 [Candidatus Yonathbacteria bacterium RIFCSPHIGHO2_01_FULL_44_41]OHA81033.1 MAG: hypothetical protein A3D51_01615 [Candidatus Yonathbacteria bacterium RIFCSPHIGHO2_02_FULL_44_14]OHA81256.1 MAG: hypothetical protein A3B06_03325 [Candidatus Yonathbacteria bacterium RIFCSPLOWO2_01_FULL_43_20]